jgi:tripeptide aminopeptidase
MESVKDRFLRYVKIDTGSEQHVERVPSTPKQLDLSRLLRDELLALGAEDVTLDAYGYVMATIPANTDRKRPWWGCLRTWIRRTPSAGQT